MTLFAIFFCSLYKFRKWNKDKILKHFYEGKKRLFISIDIRKPPMLGSYSLQHPIDEAGSTNSFSSEDASPKVSLPAKKLKPFINDSDSKENENNVVVTGWTLTSCV